MKGSVIPLLLLIFFSFNVSFSHSFMRKPLMQWSNNANIRSQNLNPRAYNAGDPLFITPYIENGKIEEVRKLARVGPLPNGPQPQLPSYSGFLTVNKTHDSNMFFWFFPAMSNAASAPVLLWLQGGPGGTSMFGLFVEHGPFIIGKDLDVTMREYTWVKEFNVLYIDNPVGTGFSFTKDEAGYANNEDDVARDLYEALRQFFTVFSEYQPNDFYVTGESYAGKYVPAIAHKIHVENGNANAANISLKGIAIGDGLCDPESMTGYSDYLFQVGLLDEMQAAYFSNEEAKLKNFIQQKKFFEAFKIFDMLLNGDLIKTPTYFTNATGMTFYFNFLIGQPPSDFAYYNNFLGLDQTRNAIHVGNLTFNDGLKVEMALVNDIMDTVKPWVAELMDNYKVLMYSGQLDIIVAAPLTESFLQTVKWKGAKDYRKATKQIWKVTPSDVEVAGYVRQVGDFYQVIVRNAGHILPYDQPKIAFDMIKRFINNNGFE